jgi:hypothetical protein
MVSGSPFVAASQPKTAVAPPNSAPKDWASLMASRNAIVQTTFDQRRVFRNSSRSSTAATVDDSGCLDMFNLKKRISAGHCITAACLKTRKKFV